MKRSCKLVFYKPKSLGYRTNESVYTYLIVNRDSDEIKDFIVAMVNNGYVPLEMRCS